MRKKKMIMKSILYLIEGLLDEKVFDSMQKAQKPMKSICHCFQFSVLFLCYSVLSHGTDRQKKIALNSLLLWNNGCWEQLSKMVVVFSVTRIVLLHRNQKRITYLLYDYHMCHNDMWTKTCTHAHCSMFCCLILFVWKLQKKELKATKVSEKIVFHFCFAANCIFRTFYIRTNELYVSVYVCVCVWRKKIRT